jgi:hypothetical protein
VSILLGTAMFRTRVMQVISLSIAYASFNPAQIVLASETSLSCCCCCSAEPVPHLQSFAESQMQDWSKQYTRCCLLAIAMTGSSFASLGALRPMPNTFMWQVTPQCHFFLAMWHVSQACCTLSRLYFYPALLQIPRCIG